MHPFSYLQQFPKTQDQPQTEGFTLVEVMVSMIMTLTFVIVTMQLFVTAAFLRAKAAEFNDAYNWIQEDFEQALTQARTYEINAVPFSTRCETGTLASEFINDPLNGLGGANVTLGTREFGGQRYELVRSATHLGTLDSTQLVAMKYQVQTPVQARVILDIDTQVLIYAALKCPKS